MSNPIDLNDLPAKIRATLTDSLGEPKGYVKIVAYHPTLKVSKVIRPWKQNLIVNSGRDVIASQIAGAIGTTAWTSFPADAIQNTITRALIGNGGHNLDNTPKTPALTDANLGTFQKEYPIDSLTRPTQTSVAFQFTIPAIEPSIPSFSEAGLGVNGQGAPTTWAAGDPGVNATHKLFARKCFGFITKVDGWMYTFTWLIVF